MKNPKDLLVTTTSGIEGVTIKQYLRPISAHIVTGTGFFSDFAASITDVFGGRSQTYQRQLSSIYNEAIESLKRSAYEIGGNCIVGLKVDLDEISGKGKSMFMVTAIGTAVVIDDFSKKTTEVNEILGNISQDKMVELRHRHELIKKAKENTLCLDDTTWEFISKNKVFEISKEVLKKAHEEYSTAFEEKKTIIQKLLMYLYSIPEENRTTLLYEYLMENESVGFNRELYSLIKDLSVYDPDKLERYIVSDDLKIRKKALQIIANDKSYYTIEDIELYDKFIRLIKENFPVLVQFSTQKKVLSSKETEIWVCSCGAKNLISEKYCAECRKDIYGFDMSQINPDSAIEELHEKIEIIKEYLR